MDTATVAPPTNAMRDCLVRLRDRAAQAHRIRDVQEIDAALANDPEAQLRALIGDAVALTPRERDLLQCIHDFRRANGFSPTLQELAEQLDVTKVTIFGYVGQLEHKGVVKRDKHMARSLTIVARNGT